MTHGPEMSVLFPWLQAGEAETEANLLALSTLTGDVLALFSVLNHCIALWTGTKDRDVRYPTNRFGSALPQDVVVRLISTFNVSALALTLCLPGSHAAPAEVLDILAEFLRAE